MLFTLINFSGMSALPKISIIVPVYNVEKYLPTCLDSIIAQSYKNLEILVVDDGAKDSSGAICDEYANKDIRIVALHKQNGGLSDARNYGMQLVTGDYISFIDSDDYVHPDYISTLYKNLVLNEADISICNFQKIKEGGKPNIDENLDEVHVYNTSDSLKQLLSGENSIQFTIACGKLFKRYIFDDIRFPKGKHYEDSATDHLWYAKAKRTVYTNRALYYYLQREGSIKSSERFQDTDMLDAAIEKLNFLKEWNGGYYKNEGFAGYVSCCLGIYPRLSEKLYDKKVCIIADLKKVLGMIDRNEISINNMLKMRLKFFIKFPGLYSRLVLALRG